VSELKQFVEAGVHFGHHTARWHPKMRPYIWGARNKIHLINVAKTAFLLERAKKFLEEVTSQNKLILWVGTKKAAQPSIKAIGEKLEMPYVAHRWIGGTLSNYDQVKKAVTQLLHLRDVQKKSLSRYSKKEQSMLLKDLERLEKNFGGIVKLNALPAALIVVDAKYERSAIKEALGMNIPVISLVDTNTDPTGITYVIPSNDDSPKAISLIIKLLGESVEAGFVVAEKAKQEAAQKAAEKKAQKNKAHDVKQAKKAVQTKEAATKAKATASPKVDVTKKTATPPKEENKKAASKEDTTKKTTASPKEKGDEKAATAKEQGSAKKVTTKKTTAKSAAKKEPKPEIKTAPSTEKKAKEEK